MRISNHEAMLSMAGHGEFLFKVTDVTANGGNIIVTLLVRGGTEFGLNFALEGDAIAPDDQLKFRELCVALGLERAPEDESEIVGKHGNMRFPTHGGAPCFSKIIQSSFPYPSEPPREFACTQGNDSTLLARRQARDISTRNGDRAHGYGLLFEIENGRISGVEDIEQSPVLWVEGELDLEVDGTRRRGLRLVEWYGKGEAPAHALRWAADVYVADSQTAAFVRAAIEEKLASDHGLALAERGHR